MDFVDEQHRTFFGVGQVGQQIFRRRERCTAGDLQVYAEVAGDACGERGLAQPGWPVEQKVAERFATLAGRVHRNRQPLVNLPLTDHVVHALGPQGKFVVAQFGRQSITGTVLRGLGRKIVGRENRFAWHGSVQRRNVVNFFTLPARNIAD